MDTLQNLPRSTQQTAATPKNDRDERFKALLLEQLGKNGISIIVLYSFVMVIAMLLLALVTVSFAVTDRRVGGACGGKPVLTF